MNIKICGITSVEEVEYINKLKPEYIGLVFTKSKRQICKEQGIVLSKVLCEEVKIVGVFKDNSLNEIKEIIQCVKLDVIQLHGNESDDFIESVKLIIEEKYGENQREEVKERIEVWKGISIKSKDDFKILNSLKVDRFILDGLKPGSGEVFDWELIKDINTEFFLAGGISLNNINEIIKYIKPYGIDVSSGVETIDTLGNRKKDYYKIKELIERVRKIYE